MITKKDFIILALDLGTKTGWATDSATGSINFKQDRFQGGGMRYLRFRIWLTEMLGLCQFNVVYFEEVRRHAGTDAAHVYGGFLAHLTAWCEENSIGYQGVPVGTIKKHATGKGSANKITMAQAYEAKWGKKPDDDNECDARWLFDLALSNSK